MKKKEKSGNVHEKKDYVNLHYEEEDLKKEKTNK